MYVHSSYIHTCVHMYVYTQNAIIIYNNYVLTECIIISKYICTYVHMSQHKLMLQTLML